MHLSMRIGVCGFLVLATCFSLPSFAQKVVKLEYVNEGFQKCGQSPGRGPNGENLFGKQARVVIDDFYELRKAESIAKLINMALVEALKDCPNSTVFEVGITQHQTKLPYALANVVEAKWYRSTRQWQITNKVEAAVAFEEQRLQAEQKKEASQKAEVEKVKKEKEQASANLDALIKTYNVETFATGQQLLTNPFVYKGKVVGVRTTFIRMVSADEALFDALLVTNVPASQFTQADQDLVLIFKVDGLKSVKNQIGMDVQVPSGKYVGVHVCKLRNCRDLVASN